jgi:hypothetical protein
MNTEKIRIGLRCIFTMRIYWLNEFKNWDCFPN